RSIEITSTRTESLFCQTFTKQLCELMFKEASENVRTSFMDLISLTAFRHPSQRLLIWQNVWIPLVMCMQQTSIPILESSTRAVANLVMDNLANATDLCSKKGLFDVVSNTLLCPSRVVLAQTATIMGCIASIWYPLYLV